MPKSKINAPTGHHVVERKMDTGGNWERLIQSIKKILKEILKSRYPPEHVLRTVLLECEKISNSRPLTHVSLDLDDAESMISNHFLIAPSHTASPLAETVEKDLNLMSSWRTVQILADIFWSRMMKEYLPILIKSSKWFQEEREKGIHVGHVVILVDSDGPQH
ncbi:hypothetical protein JTB14_029132 [Gonioctena quinquepunctata]|nr:hypothetical protein JTB14_029132 [Gonioctena quinquepunctata]